MLSIKFFAMFYYAQCYTLNYILALIVAMEKLEQLRETVMATFGLSLGSQLKLLKI